MFFRLQPLIELLLAAFAVLALAALSGWAQ